MNILEENTDSIKVDIPTNKVDVTRDADVIEEIVEHCVKIVKRKYNANLKS